METMTGWFQWFIQIGKKSLEKKGRERNGIFKRRSDKKICSGKLF